MKSTTEIKEFRATDGDGLAGTLRDLESELMNLRFKKGSAQLEQTAQLKVLRRRIARLKTVQTEQKRAAEAGQDTGPGDEE